MGISDMTLATQLTLVTASLALVRDQIKEVEELKAEHDEIYNEIAGCYGLEKCLSSFDLVDFQPGSKLHGLGLRKVDLSMSAVTQQRDELEQLRVLLAGLVGELFVLLPQRQQLRPGPALLRPDGRSKLLLKPDNCVWPKTRGFRPRISISIQLQLSDQQQQIQRIQRLIHTDTSES